jgi:hypothetical protein
MLINLLVSQFGQGKLLFLYESKINDDTGSAYQSKPAVYYKGGSIYVVFEDDRDKDGYREIYFALSQDTGKTWSKNKLISKNIAGLDEYYPWITVDKNNVLFMLFGKVFQTALAKFTIQNQLIMVIHFYHLIHSLVF